MKNQQQKSSKYFIKIFGPLIALLPIVLGIASLSSRNLFLLADLSGFNQGIDINDEFEESNDESIFKSGPLELIDAWKRATAMEDATSPQDALDQAIKAFEDQQTIDSKYD
tara:strand:- start:262 stop:594 length:333 start_codon:yes stop_codon:yes gene_type:complete